MHKYLVFCGCFVLLWACSSESSKDGSSYIRYDAKFFSIELPDNWEVISNEVNWLDAKSLDYCQVDSVRKTSLPNLTFNLDIHRTPFTDLEAFSKYHMNDQWGACNISFPNYAPAQKNTSFDILLEESGSMLKVILLEYAHDFYKEDQMMEYLALGYNDGYGIICRVGALKKEDFQKRKTVMRKILQSLVLN